MKIRQTALLLLLSTQALAAAEPAAPTSVAPAPAATVSQPLKALPYSPSLDLSAMDTAASPCEDFYQYSCGGWVKNNPIPPDQASWSVYAKLHNDNLQFLWGILDELASGSATRSATQQKIGDYFAACMDEAAIDKLDLSPMRPQLDAIRQLEDKKALAGLMAQIHLANTGEGHLFNFGAAQDYENSQNVIAFASAGGLGLPDRDYYLKTDKKSAEIRKKYRDHVERMFILLGDTAEAAKHEAATVLTMETALAKTSLSLVDKRDPRKLLHKTNLLGLYKLTPDFNWSAYLTGLGIADLQQFNVTEPGFYRELERQIRRRSVADLQAYLRWHTINANAAHLSSRFVDQDFDFYGRTLRGKRELQPRWKRCVNLVDQQLGEALGQEYVARTFTPNMKTRTVEMTKLIEDAMQQDLEQLDWMTPETRKHALEKLRTVVNKVGYPDRWRDYSSLDIQRDDFLGNVLRGTSFEAKRQLAKIGKPLDRGEWGMTPPTVNAYYDPQMNDINFPAGVLQAPLFDAKLDDAPNYGNTGSTIGHELTHGFDDEGRQFDAQGNLKDWWAKGDSKHFEQRAQCVVDQYAKYTVIDEIKINSKLTEGEDIADLGGTVLAYIAWKVAVKDQKLENIDGYTPDQRFFIGLAQWACGDERPESLRTHAMTDPHSPGKYRINGVVANLPEFQKAFSCKAGQAMVNPKPCKVW